MTLSNSGNMIGEFEVREQFAPHNHAECRLNDEAILGRVSEDVDRIFVFNSHQLHHCLPCLQAFSALSANSFLSRVCDRRLEFRSGLVVLFRIVHLRTQTAGRSVRVTLFWLNCSHCHLGTVRYLAAGVTSRFFLIYPFSTALPTHRALEDTTPLIPLILRSQQQCLSRASFRTSRSATRMRLAATEEMPPMLRPSTIAPRAPRTSLAPCRIAPPRRA